MQASTSSHTSCGSRRFWCITLLFLTISVSPPHQPLVSCLLATVSLYWSLLRAQVAAAPRIKPEQVRQRGKQLAHRRVPDKQQRLAAVAAAKFLPHVTPSRVVKHGPIHVCTIDFRDGDGIGMVFSCHSPLRSESLLWLWLLRLCFWQTVCVFACKTLCLLYQWFVEAVAPSGEAIDTR